MIKKKVFLGVTNIASQLQDLAYGFNSLGYDTLTAVDEIGVSPIVRDYYDIYLNAKVGQWTKYIRPRRLREKFHNSFTNVRRMTLNKAIKECDIFVFLWRTFYPDYEDLKELRRYGKKIIVIFVGDDIRYPHAMRQEFDGYNLKHIEYDIDTDNVNYLNTRVRYLRYAEKYADLIISAKDYSQLCLRPYYWHPGFLDLRKFRKQYKQNNKPILLHAPSSRKFKGFVYIQKAIDKLYGISDNFTFQLLENVPYNQVLDTYLDCDILIGQVLAQGGGKQDREALASGMVVCSAYDQQYMHAISNKVPIVNSTPTTLFSVLVDLINNPVKRLSIAEEGYQSASIFCVKEYCATLIEMLYSDQGVSLTRPTFFREKYEPRSEDLDILNDSTKIVSNCTWYRDAVISGSRSGLNF